MAPDHAEAERDGRRIRNDHGQSDAAKFISTIATSSYPPALRNVSCGSLCHSHKTGSHEAEPAPPELKRIKPGAKGPRLTPRHSGAAAAETTVLLYPRGGRSPCEPHGTRRAMLRACVYYDLSVCAHTRVRLNQPRRATSAHAFVRLIASSSALRPTGGRT